MVWPHTRPYMLLTYIVSANEILRKNGIHFIPCNMAVTRISFNIIHNCYEFCKATPVSIPVILLLTS